MPRQFAFSIGQVKMLVTRALIPLDNKRNVLEVAGDIVERVDSTFFSDAMTAAMKALGMT
jgi:ATP-dependent Lon protease